MYTDENIIHRTEVICFGLLLKMSINIEHWPLTIEHWPLSIEHWPLNIDHWALNIDRWPLTIEHWPLTIEHWTLSIEQWALSIEHWALTIDHWTLSIDHWILNIKHCGGVGECGMLNIKKGWRKWCSALAERGEMVGCGWQKEGLWGLGDTFVLEFVMP